MRRGSIYNKVFEMLWIMALGVLCIACSSDETTPDSPDPQPEVPREGTELSVSTRTVDVDEFLHEGISLWLALTDGTQKASEGTYIYTSTSDSEHPELPPTWSWTTTSSAKVWEAKQYYLYGAATNGGSCDVTSTDFSQGATLTINGVDPVAKSGTEPLVIVGVQGVQNPASTAWNVTEGDFGYMGIKENGKDNVYLLLDHLYSALAFSFSIDEDYSKLRTIKLTKVSLKSNLSKKRNITVSLTAGVAPITSVSFEAGTADAATDPVELFSSTEGVDISTLTKGSEAAANISAGCFDPTSASNLSVECEYNVYDKASTQPLATRKAVNSLSAVMAESPMTRGQIRNINLKVVPTYLYILSDNDLDNPTIKINSN